MAPLTCDGLAAGGALLRVHAAEALDAVGVVPLGGEGLVGQRALAARAQEALLMPGLVPIGHPALGQSLAKEQRAVPQTHGLLAGQCPRHTLAVRLTGTLISE